MHVVCGCVCVICACCCCCCACAYLYVCVYVYMYAYVYVHVYVCVCTSVYVCAHACSHILQYLFSIWNMSHMILLTLVCKLPNFSCLLACSSSIWWWFASFSRAAILSFSLISLISLTLASFNNMRWQCIKSIHFTCSALMLLTIFLRVIRSLLLNSSCFTLRSLNASICVSALYYAILVLS